MSKFSWSWDSFACSFRAVAENCLLAGVAVSEKLGEVVGIVGACADVWVILVYIALNCSLVSELSSGVVKSSKNIPGVFESWGEHTSEWVDSHNLESGETWSGSHDGKFNHELGIWGDFSEESLPSSIVHRDCFAYTCLDNFLTTVEWKVSCHNFFFLIINYNNFSYLSKKLLNSIDLITILTLIINSLNWSPILIKIYNQILERN